MPPKNITPHLTTNEILSQWPETIPVFLAHRMSCVGCLMSAFDTLEDASIVHGLPVDDVVRAMNQRLEENKPEEVDHDHD